MGFAETGVGLELGRGFDAGRAVRLGWERTAAADFEVMVAGPLLRIGLLETAFDCSVTADRAAMVFWYFPSAVFLFSMLAVHSPKHSSR